MQNAANHLGHAVSAVNFTEADKSRFWKKVQRGTDDDCWNWTACRIANRGYGLFFANKKHISAHRFCFCISAGNVPEGMHVLHKCDNRICCNPSHLFIGTNADNHTDKVAKGRQAKGETSGPSRHPERMRRGDNHPFRMNPKLAASGDRNGARTRPDRVPKGEDNGQAKLTRDQVIQIRAIEGISNSRLAERFNVSRKNISKIRNRLSWRHVP